ncbi:PREDICTED: uncharacterized protein LOC107193731 [Dufourea novaeangliae]|uniref:uncharacterized protein LOC107193731 n=1 Tax=Dufourea novaeangliae TaxID=178035 RepID=UPI000767C8CB|nr:PREDICTED: uncharacterized protein LOC107193731 [Dufourea novaeangliae]
MDYHDEMNDETILEWFQVILPKLKPNAIIVMVNAPYHSKKLEMCPNATWNKDQIFEWLQGKGQAVEQTKLKVELLDMVAQLKRLYDKYVIDDYVTTFHMKVLRQPPYHFELNPIELAWSCIKSYVKRNNTSYVLAGVEALLRQATDKVTSEMWSNFVRHTIGEEDKLFKVDTNFDEDE